MDRSIVWTGLIYFAGLCLLHVAWWQALIVVVAVSISWYLNYSRRFIATVGAALLLLGLACGSDSVAKLSDWFV